MSQSHYLQVHLSQLGEIRSILNAMKNLAFMEIHKLSRYYAIQGKALANIDRVGKDFLSFYPAFGFHKNSVQPLCIVIGSERGFCGDFNERLINTVKIGNYTNVLVVGSRLVNRFRATNHAYKEAIIGANITEEVPMALNQLIEAINALPEFANHSKLFQSAIHLNVIYHDCESGQIKQRTLFPPFLQQENPFEPLTTPPILTLAPQDFYSELIHHYLFTVLHEVFYHSLLAENHSRLQHLDSAVKHLDDNTVGLRRKLQTFRQEEITEEIEVILLNSENY